MLWFETYLHCCSVRLGVIIMTIIKALEHVTISFILLGMGISAIEPILKLVQNNQQIKQIHIIKILLNWIDHSPSTLLITVQIYLMLYVSGCLSALYGALKLKKWYLMPFIVFDGLQIAIDLIVHSLLMIVLKNHLNLGGLIGVTILGVFILLFLGYNWTAAVSMFLIIQLINSKYYQAIYGISSSTANNFKVKKINVSENHTNANNAGVYKISRKYNEKDVMMSQFKQYTWWQTKRHNHPEMHKNWLYGELVNNIRTSNIILKKF